ncbi:MAG: sulfur carrier protein ThiS [Bacteroidota bacterium]|nr:sulfur carrier protein ThiS [Bacteroidota bacterium]
MKIKLNNREEFFDQDQLSVDELIQEKNFTFKLLVTRVNGKLVNKGERSTSIVKDGDDVAILHMISGG